MIHIPLCSEAMATVVVVDVLTVAGLLILLLLDVRQPFYQLKIP